MAKQATVPRAPASTGCAHGDGEIRCDCGSLLARWTDGGLEIKCRRCKRRFVVRISGARISGGRIAGSGRAPPTST